MGFQSFDDSQSGVEVGRQRPGLPGVGGLGDELEQVSKAGLGLLLAVGQQIHIVPCDPVGRADEIEGQKVDEPVLPVAPPHDDAYLIEVDVIGADKLHPSDDSEQEHLPGQQVVGKILLQGQPLGNGTLVKPHIRPLQHRQQQVFQHQLLFPTVDDATGQNAVHVRPQIGAVGSRRQISPGHSSMYPPAWPSGGRQPRKSKMLRISRATCRSSLLHSR